MILVSGSLTSGTATRDLLYRRSLNVPAPSTTPYSASRKPWQQYANVYFASNGDGIGKAGSDYHAMQFDVQKRFGAGIYFQGAWTWSKLLADVEDARSEFGPHIENPFDVSRERAVEAYSPRHRVVGVCHMGSPELAARQWLGANMPGFAGSKLLGQWSLSSYIILETGSVLHTLLYGEGYFRHGFELKPQHE